MSALVSFTGCSSFSGANPNIAFMGDSITAFWYLPRTNLGVAGDTTAQMLARFSSEVVGHDRKAVVILGGTNDIRNTKLPIGAQVTEALANLQEMASEAEEKKITVVLCAIPPIRSEDARVQQLNAGIEQLAHDHHYLYVDYYTPMAGHAEYFKDGLHPDTEGYFVMEQALVKVLPLSY